MPFKYVLVLGLVQEAINLQPLVVVFDESPNQAV